jgi:hypothetical protein
MRYGPLVPIDPLDLTILISILVVSGTAVKPAVDENGLIMIPLEKPNAKNPTSAQILCIVEIIFLIKVCILYNHFLLSISRIQ